MNQDDILKGYDPNATGKTSNNIFSLPFSPDNARVVFIPMPWDVTVSNFEGTSAGPQKIFETSFQIDLFDPFAPDAWKQGMAMESIDPAMINRNHQLRRKSSHYINFLELGGNPEDNDQMKEVIEEINNASEELSLELEFKSLMYLEQGKVPVVLGGEHSVPLGLIRAIARKRPGFGILQIDAHADLREAYQGFSHSHASIMHNALKTEGVGKLVQVGIRELCPEEIQFISKSPGKIRTYFDRDLHNRLFEGESWSEICQEIVKNLPDEVYVSLDVDGLDPALCPGTGTPLPGGLSFNQAIYLLETILNQGKKIIGADLVETGPGEIDGIVSSRLLFRLAGMILKSNPDKGK
jgi:agmatinase